MPGFAFDFASGLAAADSAGAGESGAALPPLQERRVAATAAVCAASERSVTGEVAWYTSVRVSAIPLVAAR